MIPFHGSAHRFSPRYQTKFAFIIADSTSFFNYFSTKLSQFETILLWVFCKKGSCLQDSSPAAGRFSDIYLSAAVQSCPAGLFYATGDSNGISYCIRKTLENTEFSRVLWFLLKIYRYQITYPSALQLPLQSSLPSSRFRHRSRNERSL